MKTKLLNYSLGASAILLLAANIYVRSSPENVEAEQTPAARKGAIKTATARPKREIEEAQPRPAPATEAIRWAPLETEDYSQYMANLRKFGFPEELIRHIITAEIDALYAPRIDPLRTKPIPHDAPVSERNRWSTEEDIVRLRELQRALIEKRDRLEALLGGNVPREMIRTPVSRNYEASEYAVTLMPPEKQERVRVILENTWLEDDENISKFGKGGQQEMKAYEAAHERRTAELKKILTAEELEQLELNVMPQGTELQREIIGMDASDKELLGIFRIANDLWYENGGVYGRWRARGIPGEQIRENDKRAEAKVEQLLGPDRYIDYRMARNDTGRQLNNLAARYDVTREAIREAYIVQSELDQLRKQNPNNPIGDAEQRAAELNAKLNDVLGPVVLGAWQNGRNIRYRIEP